MKAPRLDFVAKPRLAGAAGWLLLASGLALVGYDYFTYRDLNERSAELAAQESAAMVLDAQAAGDRDAKPLVGSAELRRQLQLASAVVQKIGVPWASLFHDIGDAADKDVGLLSIQPEAAGRTLHIEAEARDLPSLAGYVQRLAERPTLRNVYIVTHELRDEGGQHSVRFGVNATWGAQ